MPSYEHEGIVVRFPDQAAGMSVSGLLSNKGVFHVKMLPGGSGELFAFISPTYTTRLLIADGAVEFWRNSYVARMTVGAFKKHFQILLSWKPDEFQLELMIDNQIGGPDACITVSTEPIYVPLDLLTWARRFNLLPRATYGSPAEFLGVFIESLRQAHKNIRDTNSVKLFWDRQHSSQPGYRLVPKREPEAMAGIAGFLQDQSMVAGYQLIRESGVGAGSLDLRAIAPLRSGGVTTICVEGKNAHSDDLEHGIVDQLPAYMQSCRADFGIYLVLWYQCEEFSRPPESAIDTTWALTKKRPWETIAVEQFDLGLPKSPSERNFSFT